LNIPKEQTSYSIGAAAKVNLWLRNYIYYITLTGVFSLLLIVHFGLSVRIMEVNLLVICLLMKVTRISGWILWFLIYLAVSGAIGVAEGKSSLPWVVVEYRAIAVNVLYYYFFFKLIGNDFERAFATYARIAFWFAIVAFPLWAGRCIAAHEYVRLAGLATEPAQFCLLILPAFYWYAHQFLATRMHAVELVVFGLAVILSSSSLGFIGVTFGIFLLLSGRLRHLVIAPVVVCSLLGLAYAVSPDFRLRATETFFAATTGDLAESNASTFSLISNALVTQRVLEESPLIGNGLGSHPTSHEHFLNDLGFSDYFFEYHMENLNRLEAGSLTLRVLSEFGILGYLGVLAFVVHFYVGGRGPHAAISKAILVTFFLKLFRSGEYYQPEQFFFIFIYILNYSQFKRNTGARFAVGRLRPTRRLPSGLQESTVRQSSTWKLHIMKTISRSSE
jgi:hypothetical protein